MDPLSGQPGPGVADGQSPGAVPLGPDQAELRVMDPEERLPALLRDLRGHHYRVSRTALAAADATVFELTGNSESWIHDDPGQPAPALVAAT